MSSSRDLRYGDYIMLVSSEGGKRFLTARSIIEENIYLLEEPEVRDINGSLYDNPPEMLFAIYPKLYYEASRNYAKHIRAEEAKKFILKKRMETEVESNLIRIQRFKGELVLVGNEVQLYHIYSKSFVKATREKNSKSPQLSSLRLSKTLGSGMVFKIKTNPNFNFKKEGEKITLDDQFYFENPKLKSNIVYKQVPMIESVEEKKEEKGKSFFGLFSSKKKKVEAKGPSINYLSVLERNGLFKQFEACHSPDVNLFEAIPVKSPVVEKENVRNYRWGDFVRIKHLSEKKKLGTLFSDQNVVGSFPTVLLGFSQKCQYSYENESYTSIFQLVPRKVENMGNLIQFENEGVGSVNIILRHFLSGRFLNLNGKCSLVEGLEEFHNANPDYIQNKKKEDEEKKKKEKKTNTEPEIKGGKLEAMAQKKTEQAQEQVEPPKEEKEKEDPFKTFLKRNKIVLATSLKENEKYLSSSNIFLLRSALSENYIMISKDKALLGDSAEKQMPFVDDDYFNKIFIGMNPLNKVNKEISFGENGQMMFFSPVSDEEIIDIMNVKSLYFPLMKLSENFDFYKKLPNLIAQCEYSIVKLSLWACDSSEKNVQQIKSKAINIRQKLMREAGIIDVLVKIIHDMFTKNLLQSKVLDQRYELFSLSKNIFVLLYYINQENFPNSIYTMQWYSLFKTLILSDEISKEIEIDKLVINLFEVTDLNVSYQGDLRQVVSKIRFEHYNVSAMRLLLAFCSYAKHRSPADQEDLVQQVFDDDNKLNIFRPLAIEENNQVSLNVNETRKIYLEENVLKSEKKLFPYTTEMIKLAVELCRGSLGLVYDEFSKFFPLEACVTILLNPKLNSKIKNVFLKLIRECYLVFDFRHINQLKFPSFVKIIGEARERPRSAQEAEETLISAIRERYFKNYEIDENTQMTFENLNLKVYINDFLSGFFSRDLKAVTKEDHKMVSEIIGVCDYLFNHKLYTYSEAFLLKKELIDFLQNGYVCIDVMIERKNNSQQGKQEINDAQGQKGVVAIRDEDVGSICEWMIHIINCLHTIIKMEQDQMVEEFMGEKIYAKLMEITSPKSKVGASPTKSKGIKLEDTLEYIRSLDYPPTTEIYYFIEVLQLNHIKLSQKVIELLYSVFSLRRNFMWSLNNVIPIGKERIMLFSKLEHLKLLLHQNLRELEHCHGGQIDQIFDNHLKIDKNLLEVLKLACKLKKRREDDLENNSPQNKVSQKVDIPPPNQSIFSNIRKERSEPEAINSNPVTEKLESEKNLNIKLEFANEEEKLTKIDLTQKVENDQIGKSNRNFSRDISRTPAAFTFDENSRFMYVILDEYAFDVRESFQKQELFKKLGIHEEIIDILNKTLAGVAYRDRSASTRKDIIEKSLVFLIFFVLKNETNQEEFRLKKGFKITIKTLLGIDSAKIQKLSMLLIYELYRDNYHLLLEYEPVNSRTVRNLNKNYDNYFKKNNKEYCVMYFELMVFFFKIEKQSFFQNQEWVRKEIEIDRVNLLGSLTTCYKDAMKMNFKDSVNASEKIIRVPSEISLLVAGLNFLSQLCENSTLTVTNYCKGFLTIQQVIEGLKAFQGWYPLRLELITYLSQTYLKSKKLEENEFQAIRNLIRDYFIQFITEYRLAIDPEQRSLADYKLESSTSNIFSLITHYSSEKKQIDITYSDSEEIFILFGVCEAAYNYFKKLPIRPGEQDIIVLEAYDRTINELLQELDMIDRSEDYDEMKEKMLGKKVHVIKGRVFFKEKVDETASLLNRKKKAQAKEDERETQVATVGERIVSEKKEQDELSKTKQVNAKVNQQISNQQQQIIQQGKPGSQIIKEKQDSKINIKQDSKADIKQSTQLKTSQVQPNQKGGAIQQQLKPGAEIHSKNVNASPEENPEADAEEEEEEEEEVEDEEENLISEGVIIKKERKEPNKLLLEVLEQLKLVKSSETYEKLMNRLEGENRISIVETAIQKSLGEKIEIFPETIIENEQTAELDFLVGYLIEMKVNEVKDLFKFKRIVQNLINVIANDDKKSFQIRMHTMKIIRRLANYKKDVRIYQEIQKDLAEVGLMKFLCQALVNEVDEKTTLEYILGLIDFMDEANRNIQMAFHDYLRMDEECSFLIRIRNFILETFNEFRDYEKNIPHNKQNQSPQLKKIMRFKLTSCTSALEVLRLSCEGHFDMMQNFLREQMHNGKISLSSTNFITFFADLLEKYSKMISIKNIKLGEKIIDVLIETIQGPCMQNQLLLCNSKILENLEDILFELRGDPKFTKYSNKISSFTNKITILMISLLEGNTDPYILSKVGSYFSPELMFQRLEEIYTENIKNTKPKLQDDDKKKERKNQSVFKTFFDKTLEQDSDSYIEMNIEEGFNIYILKKTLQQNDPNFNLRMLKWKQDTLIENDSVSRLWVKSMNAAFRHFKRGIATIEIVNRNDELQKIYFRLPTITKYMSYTSKKMLLDSFPRESPNDKISGLLDAEQEALDEMNHFMFLRSKGIKSPYYYFSSLRNLNLLVAVILSLIILFTSENSEKSALHTVGAIQLTTSVLTWVAWAIFQMPLDLKRVNRDFEIKNINKNRSNKSNLFLFNNYSKRIQSVAITLFFKYLNFFILFCADSYFVILTLNVFFAILGIAISRVFFTLLLLDIVDRSPILKNVVKSVTLNYIQLLMTFLLGAIIIYIYSMIGYYSNLSRGKVFNDNNGDNFDICENPFYCFLFIINVGLRSGGGVGEILNQPSYTGDSVFVARFFFDLSFFIIITIIWLNIIFGIIIDTFAQLRDIKKDIDFDKKYRCFICNLDRTEFEKEGISFTVHTFSHHNLWNYLYFVIYLHAKEPSDYNGIESYISEKIGKNDISWFPIGRSLDLKNKDKDESEIKVLEKKLDSIQLLLKEKN